MFGSTARRLSLVMLAPLLLAGRGYDAVPMGNMILALETPADPARVDRVKIGDLIFRQGIVRAKSARLDGPLSLAIAGETIDLVAGEILVPVGLSGGPAEASAGQPQVYCALPRPMDTAVAASKAVIGAIGFGLFSGLQRTKLGSRFCLIDADGDNLVEKAVLVGANRKSEQMPQAIAPTPIIVASRIAFTATSEITLRYLGPVGMLSNIGFEVQVLENGRTLALAEYRVVVKPSALPKSLKIHGAQFTVTDYDPISREASVIRERGFPEGAYRFAAPPQQFYVYVPG